MDLLKNLRIINLVHTALLMTAIISLNSSDKAIAQTGTDFGDAPDSYGDASHQLSSPSQLHLGSVEPDSEADTQLTSGESAGDDDDGNDDEDAFIVLPNVPLVDPSLGDLSLGREYSLDVPVTNTTGGNATLHAWIDFNQNGKFEAGEYQTATVANGATSVNLNWDIANILGLDVLTLPLTTLAGDTHARFRLTTDNLTDLTGLADVLSLGIDDRSVGNASDGEVEDYPVSIAVPLYDYGDAPDTGTGTGTGNYQTTESDEGPTHIAINDPVDLLHLSLGNTVDGDAGDLQNIEADADDVDTQNVDLLGSILAGGGTGVDDEDGVTSFPALTADAGQTYTVPVTVRNNVPLLNAYLVGYIDFNQDGDFDDAGENSTTVTVPSDLLEVTNNSLTLDTTGDPRTFNVTFTVPAGVTPGDTYARFRLGSIKEIVESATGITVSTDNGEVNNGEVEDYKITIAEATGGGNSATTDYGDAPESYRDASHEISSSLYIGRVEADGEADTQLTSSPSAGDDDDGNDDEDGFIVLPNIPLADPSLSDLSIGREYSLDVPVTNTTGTNATLHAWIDFNQNGEFEAGEYQSATVANGATSVNLNWDIANILGLDVLTVPLTTLAGDTHARFRLTTDELTDKTNITDLLDPLIPLNLDDRSISNATDGEVEDYPVSIAVPLVDYGDAPDTGTGTATGNYQTTESDGGPTHIAINDPLDLLHLSLGDTVDGDAGDLQNIEADADDVDTQNVDLLGSILTGGGTGADDEDGVANFPTLTAAVGETYTVPVTVRNNIPLLNAYLVGYIDFNQDGDFDDAGEKSATVTVPSDLLDITNGLSLDLTGDPRTFNVTFTVPEGVTPGNTYARFRLGSIQQIVESATTVSVATANDEVNNGEVEDYQIAIAPPAASIDLDGDNSSGAANNGLNTVYVLGGSPVQLLNDSTNEALDTVITVSDGTQVARAVIILTNPLVIGDSLSIDPTALDRITSGAITADTSIPNQIALNGNASPAIYEAALESIEFSTTNSNDTSDRIITLQVTNTESQASVPATLTLEVIEIFPVECEYCTSD